MSLKKGPYIIRTHDRGFVGRRVDEDSSSPKVIVKHLNQELSTPYGEWYIEQVGPDPHTYLMSIMGNYVSQKESSVVVVDADGSSNDSQPQEWIIKDYFSHGPDFYVITAKDQKTGWMYAHDGPPEQEPITCRPFADQSQEPEYRPNEIFLLTPPKL
ncbi:hypothetical protein L218DRAFT_964675 [Marasmius fiardii PR-910]|nr:hypothetical protein L218DRAFT_964675 [Marasmius fiardii PR-910]